LHPKQFDSNSNICAKSFLSAHARTNYHVMFLNSYPLNHDLVCISGSRTDGALGCSKWRDQI